jgi:hypothetical protein
MSRISFGSRAGDVHTDYNGTGTVNAYRTSHSSGTFSSLLELTDALTNEIKACSASEVPNLTTCELSLREEAVVPLLRPHIGPYADGGEHDLPPEYKAVWTDGNEGFHGLKGSLPKASVSEVLAAGDGQTRQIVQRAASRAIVQSIEATDGFKYSFNNAWAAKDEGGLRYSYICQDSMQNKDRHANGFTKTLKHLKGEGERGPRKPTYDCKGSISVKFNFAARKVHVYYRHNAIHASVAERRNPHPRINKPRVSHPQVDESCHPAAPQEPDTGGLLGQLQNEHTAYEAPRRPSPPVTAPQPVAPKPAKSLKRRRDSGMDSNKPMSLAELLQQSDGAHSPAVTKSPLVQAHAHPPPVDYNLPSWDVPLPPPPPPKVPLPPPRPQHGNWSNTAYQRPDPPYKYQAPPSAPSPMSNPSVTIPKKGRAPPYITQVSEPAQKSLGAPSGKQHPQAQGLFSTLKPVKKEAFHAYEPQFVMYRSAQRAKNSCQNCRISKKKV